MTFLLLASATLAVGTLSWLHLRPAGARRAAEVPSLQLLCGPSPKRRRRLPLEEPLAWGLRTAALLLALAGTWASRSGCAEDKRPVVVVDGALSLKAWEEARARLGAPTLLGFRAEEPRALGEDGGPAEAALRACSDTRAACLLRTALRTGRPVVLWGAFSAAEWRLALAQWRHPFSFVLQGGAEEGRSVLPPPPPPRARVRLLDTSPAARLWAAALAEAAGEGTSPVSVSGQPEPPLLEVRAAGRPSQGEAALSVFAVASPAAAQPDAPAVERRARRGLLLPDPTDVAAGTAGLGLSTSLAFGKDARFTQVLPLAALRGPRGQRELALAATAEELGDWAHGGNLLPLARALLAAGLPGPTAVETAPAGGALAWEDAENRPAPVGLLDVPPGRYRRSDGQVLLQLSRPQVPGEGPLDEVELKRLGGSLWGGGASPPPRLSGMFFSSALLLFLCGLFLTRRARQAWLAAAAVAAALALLVADVRWPREVSAPFAALLAVPPGPAARELLDVGRAAAVALGEGTEGWAKACAALGALQPCTLLGTVGLASAPAPGVDVLLFDAARPRVDVLSVEAPREVPLGAAAEVWTTVRVRRAEGQRLTLSVHSTSAAPTSEEVVVDGPDVLQTLRLSVTPLSEGVAFLAVRASVAGEKQAEDGRLLALAARVRKETRLVLAASPGWEARAAAAALEAPGVQVDVLSLLGARATVARGRAAQTPRELLQKPEALQGLGLLALVGFGLKDLDGPAAAALRRYVESGGAALVLDAPGAAAALGVEVPLVPSAAPLESLAGQLASLDAVNFRGYAPASGFQVPAGAAVLGRVRPEGATEAVPWVVGRALGKGRVVVVAAPDAWRVSSPGTGGDAYRRALGRLVGWLEAPRASRGGVVLAEDWASLAVLDGPRTRVVPLPAAGTVDGLPVDAVDVLRFNHSPRAALRAAALGQHHPFLELDGAEALLAAWRRLPPPPRFRAEARARSSDGVFAALATLFVLEALRRRRYGGGGRKGSRASREASEGETGGMTSGVGKSQRARMTPASREAALNVAPSWEA